MLYRYFGFAFGRGIGTGQCPAIILIVIDNLLSSVDMLRLSLRLRSKDVQKLTTDRQALQEKAAKNIVGINFGPCWRLIVD